MKYKLLSLFLLAFFAVGCLGMTTVVTPASAATDNYNKTLTVQSGYESAFLAPVSPLFDYLGASVQFDLYKSDFKSLNYNKSYDVMSLSGTSGGMASVNFVFGKVEEFPYTKSPHIPAWHIYQITEFNFGGFQYFCNGQIKEWSDRGNYALITDFVGTPNEFMEEGYSYKVSLTYDSFTYNGQKYGGNSAWFVVERKGIFENDSAFEVLFAFQKRIDAARFGERYTNGTMAGMEIQGLCPRANIAGTATSGDGRGHSVNVEIDNLKIYDGTSYDEAEKRYYETFETITANDVAMPALMQTGENICKFDGENYLELPSGIRFNAVNYSEAIGKTEETTAQLGVEQSELFNVTFKDAATGQTVGTTKTCTGLDFSATKIYSGSKVYKFDYSSIDFSSVNEDLVVYGTPVSYFTLSLISGVKNINDKVLRISVEDSYKIAEDILVRPDYDLLGFTTSEGSSVVQYDVGAIVNMNCRDKTLYAVWKLKSFQTDYYSGKVKLDSITTKPGEVPYYRGTTPKKDGYIFAGWSEVIAPSKNQTLVAQFVEAGDTDAANKALSVNDSLKLTRERSDSASTVEITFDLVSLPQGAKITVMDKDVTAYVKQGCRVKVAVTNAGNITVSNGYINSDKYVYAGSAQTGLNSKSVSVEFRGNVVFDTYTISYDGENFYEENFDGIDNFAAGIYNNYYMVEGSASVVSLPKNNIVTFTDETTGRNVSQVHVYDGGNVFLPDTVNGTIGTVNWDKTQDDLMNVTGNVTVKANMNWINCTLNFDTSEGVFGFLEIEDSIASIKGIFGQTIELPTIEYGNYEIIGWTDVKDGGYVKFSGEYSLNANNKTLYPVWGGKIYTVEFYAEDGVTLLERQDAEYNSTVLFGGEIPAKAGYDFVGWDKPTMGISGDTKFTAVYEKSLANVTVSVLGGNGSGKYTEGDTVTISFREINGYEFTGWKVVSGGVTIKNNNGTYTFTVGNEEVVIEAEATTGNTSKGKGCGSAVGAGFIGALALICLAFFMVKRRKGIYEK